MIAGYGWSMQTIMLISRINFGSQLSVWMKKLSVPAGMVCISHNMYLLIRYQYNSSLSRFTRNLT